MTEAPEVAQVVMPERGLFLVRCVCPPPPRGAQAVVSLDYGLDMGRVVSAGRHDPARHGDRLPGFQLVRAKTDADDAALAENAARADAMRAVFLKAAAEASPGLRVPDARLSFGRRRLFVRLVSPAPQPDLSRAVDALRRQFGVSVSVWHLGARDEVAALGGMGPCGRPCCCATWMTRYPANLAAARPRGGCPAGMTGTCGRFKCCLAFERPAQGESKDEGGEDE